MTTMTGAGACCGKGKLGLRPHIFGANNAVTGAWSFLSGTSLGVSGEAFSVPSQVSDLDVGNQETASV